MSLTIKQAFEALSASCGAGMKNPFFVMRRLKESFADAASKVVDAGGSVVSVTAELTEGTKIGTITVDGDDTDLYAPAGGGGGGINYSTTEQDTGLKWIDGKALYQRTFEFTTPSGNNWTAISDSVIDSSYFELVSCMYRLPAFHANYSTTSAVNYRYNADTKKFEVQRGDSSFSSVESYVTIRYTKNT